VEASAQQPPKRAGPSCWLWSAGWAEVLLRPYSSSAHPADHSQQPGHALPRCCWPVASTWTPWTKYCHDHKEASAVNMYFAEATNKWRARPQCDTRMAFLLHQCRQL